VTQTHPRPILVTGAHRTGTTWVGRMLAAHPKVAYISEPLNMLHHPGILRARVPHWYTYVCRENESDFFASFQDLIAYRYHFAASVAAAGSVKDVLRVGRDLCVCLDARLFQRRPLFKDPFAIFSVLWFAERLNCEIVVTIRHPAAFASSLKRLNWPFDFGDLLRQPLLMRDYLERYRPHMQAARADDIIGQASLLWAMIYRVVHTAADANPAMRVVRHEDLSMDPIVGFHRLYDELGLSFSPAVQRAILRSSRAGNPAELRPGRMHSVKLDSRASLDNWRRRLSTAEVARVRAMTADMAGLYYPEVDWN
jgi:hypothetical protein